jgi:hypothetical protein
MRSNTLLPWLSQISPSILAQDSDRLATTTQYYQTFHLLIRPSKPQRLPPSRRIRLKHRLLRQTRHSRAMPRLQTLVVIRSIMHRDSAKKSQPAAQPPYNPTSHKKKKRNSPVIPQRTRPSSPIEPYLNIHIPLIHLEQILQDRIALARI